MFSICGILVLGYGKPPGVLVCGSFIIPRVRHRLFFIVLVHLTIICRYQYNAPLLTYFASFLNSRSSVGILLMYIGTLCHYEKLVLPRGALYSFVERGEHKWVVIVITINICNRPLVAQIQYNA